STPGTRARTSAERYGDRRPTSSRSSGTVCGWTSSTPTCGGGGLGACSGEHAARASRLQARSRGWYIVMEWLRMFSWGVSGSGSWRREGAQEAVDGEFGPPGPRLGRVAVGREVALPVEIQTDDHAQQELARAVRIVMPEQAAAHGLLQPPAQAVEQGPDVVLVHRGDLLGKLLGLDGDQARSAEGAGLGQVGQMILGESDQRLSQRGRGWSRRQPRGGHTLAGHQVHQRLLGAIASIKRL